MISTEVESEAYNFSNLANPGVRTLNPYITSKTLDDLEREFGIKDVVYLASNENPRGPSPLVQAHIRDVFQAMGRYPDGSSTELKAALALKHDIDPACITIGNGSNDVLDLIARVFLVPGYNAIFSQHAFAVYPIATQTVGAEPRMITANPADHLQPYGHNLQAMLAAVDEKTRVIFIANPNNPTGTWLDAEELEEFICSVPKSVIIVVDEAYFEYVGQSDYPDTSRWVKRYPNLVVMRTFSKAYGLAGLRVGYSISDPHVCDLLNRTRQPFNVNSIAQVAAIAALQDSDFLASSIQMNGKGMDQLASAFTALGLAYIPSVGNFISVNVGKSAQPAYQALLRSGVIVRPVENYGLDGFVRITVGLPDENNRLINSLQEIFENEELVSYGAKQ